MSRCCRQARPNRPSSKCPGRRAPWRAPRVGGPQPASGAGADHRSARRSGAGRRRTCRRGAVTIGFSQLLQLLAAEESSRPRTSDRAGASQDARARRSQSVRRSMVGRRLIAVHEDGSPIRHEWYSDEFQRLRERAGLRRIHLKALRNTSVSLMLGGGSRTRRRRVARSRSGSLAVDLLRRQRADLRRRVRIGAGPLEAPSDTDGPLIEIPAEPPKQKTRSDTGQSGFSWSG